MGNSHGLSLRGPNFNVQLIVNAIHNILKLCYALDQTIQHQGINKLIQSNLFQCYFSLCGPYITGIRIAYCAGFYLALKLPTP